MKRTLLLSAFLISGELLMAQSKKQPKTPPAPAPVAPAAPGAAPVNPNPVNKAPASAPKPYSQVITNKAVTDDGFFKVHKLEERFYFEIPDSLVGRDILVVNRISKAAAGVRVNMAGYAGDQIGDNVVRFEKGPSHKLFLKSMSFGERASDTTGMFHSVLNSSVQPIVAAFEIKAYGKDSVSKAGTSVIDMTDYLNSDNDIFFFDQGAKKNFSLGNILGDRSYIDGIRAFKTNIELRTVKTYMKTSTPMPSAPPSSSPVTYELNSSIVLLPKDPMKPRYFDPRVGYFATGYVDFDANPQGVKQIALITRWRLEPKPEDVERYKRGELVEPAKPIVFYIDPATPKKWIPYLIQGVNDWQVAFEKAGFKNAIMAKEAPKDRSWSIDDAGHNAIVYKPSDIPNASGPHVNDPRSGEIIETHINWYHNVMSLVHDWYFIQAAAIDPKARKMKFDDELMGQLIRFVSSHEVGHTLGLRHNFGSSSTVPVENLRNKKWVEEHGHTPSIMDYARFNYVAQPEDNISSKGIFPRIGDYDMWAIEWGYKWLPEYKTPAEESAALNKVVIAKLAANKRLWFGTETDPNDPRSQNEDLGDNAMLASTYGIKNLKRILPNIISWTKEPNEDYSSAKTIYQGLVTQYGRYMGHVAKNVGGVYSTPKRVEEQGAVYKQVPFAVQKQAVAFLNKELFNTPTWLVNKQLASYTGADPVSSIRNIQTGVLGRLLNPGNLIKLVNAEATFGTGGYTAINLFGDLKRGIWTELQSGATVDLFRRNLQKAYIDNLDNLLKEPSGAAQSSGPGPRPGSAGAYQTDISSIVRAHLVNLQAEIQRAVPKSSGITRYHLQDSANRIKRILNRDDA
ncbi:zinc-dependent metalloprotease [Desertivirga brevis]|uniref:zinc-dependent metalloprotease n=1 Tax=Desertivirga brevis TaxID=2810310 RepID=UPI001A956BF7|nr:zinc-dependent metalloprotease [Pedobacter sp. SYSU D00873]